MQEIAQKLVNELEVEIKKKVEESKLLEGAIQGINLLYTNWAKAEEQKAEKDGKDTPSKNNGKKSKAEK